MRKKTSFERKSAGCVLVFWACASFIPSFAHGQFVADHVSSAPEHEHIRFSLDSRYGMLITDFHPSLESYRYTNVKIDRLPERFRKISGESSSEIIVRPETRTPDTSVKWQAAVQESLLYTGIMHTFNIWTDPGTRDALNGPWLKDYLDSVSELRGWSDSDRFMAPYVGHTIEGSIFGYIERQNDPRYRKVQ